MQEEKETDEKLTELAKEINPQVNEAAKKLKSPKRRRSVLDARLSEGEVYVKPGKYQEPPVASDARGIPNRIVDLRANLRLGARGKWECIWQVKYLPRSKLTAKSLRG